ELLGQRRAALYAAATGYVTQKRPRHADRIDAVMVVKSPVLDGHERLGQVRRQVDEPDGGPARVAAIGDEGAIVGEDGDIWRALGHRELIDRRQLARVISEKAGQDDCAPN